MTSEDDEGGRQYDLLPLAEVKEDVNDLGVKDLCASWGLCDILEDDEDLADG